MTYIFTLQLKLSVSTLSLLKDGESVGERTWPEARDMGQKLFQAMDELLQEHGLKPEDIADLVVESELPDVYTSARIAETVKKVYTFGVKVKNK
jgi:tRNA A37 threonylcarbamoyladenosine modification protein TsaB